MNEVDARAILAPVIGNRIERVNRVHYVHSGEMNDEVGAVELIFRDGFLLYLDSGGDGESLVVKSTPWVDVFEHVLTVENQEFVRTYGKWTRLDVSRGEGYRDLIGKSIDAVNLELNPEGKVVGATLWISPQILHVEVEADDLYVQLA